MSMKALKDAVEGSLGDAGVPLQNAQAELQTFYSRIEGPYMEALAAGDKLSLKTFRDRAAMLLGRVSFRTLHRYRTTVMTTAMTVLRVLVALK